jgi:hypothetical protein
MDLQQKLALLDLDKVNMQGAGQNSTFRKAGDPTIEAILIDNAEGRPPLNININYEPGGPSVGSQFGASF